MGVSSLSMTAVKTLRAALEPSIASLISCKRKVADLSLGAGDDHSFVYVKWVWIFSRKNLYDAKMNQLIVTLSSIIVLFFIGFFYIMYVGMDAEHPLGGQTSCASDECVDQ